VQRRNQKEALRLASFDNHKRLPTQLWYDQLRASDDGSFSNTNISNKGLGIDPIDYVHRNDNMPEGKFDRQK
jgi:hypothetical protein